MTKRYFDLVYKLLNANSKNTNRVHFNLLKAASRKTLRGDISKNEPTGKTNEEISRVHDFVFDEVPTLPAIANAAVHATTQTAVTA